jgi:protein-tyrosine-phosphatase/phosphohistidine swiveling domain-containing protein
MENNINELIERAVYETNQLLRHPPEPVRPEQIHVVDKLPPGMKRRDPIRWREDGNIYIHENLVKQIAQSHREKDSSEEDIKKAIINLLKSIIARFYYIVCSGYNEWNRQKIGSVSNILELSKLREALNDLAEIINLTFHDHHLALIDQTLKNNRSIIVSKNLAIFSAKYGTDTARQLYKHVPKLLGMTLPYTWPAKEEITAFIKNRNVPFIVRTRKIVSFQRLVDLSKYTVFPETPHEYEIVNGYRFIYTPGGITSEDTKVYPPSAKVNDNIYEVEKLKDSPQIKKLRTVIDKFNTLIDANFAGLELMFTNSETLTSRITEVILGHLEKMVDLYAIVTAAGDRSDGESVSRAFERMKSDVKEELSFYSPYIPLPEDMRARITRLRTVETLEDVSTVHEMFNYVHIQSLAALDSAATKLGKNYYFLLKDKFKIIDANERPWIDSSGIIVNPLMRSVLSWVEEETEGRIVFANNRMWAHIRMGDHSAMVNVHPFPPDEGGMLSIAYAEGRGYYQQGRAFRVTLIKHVLEALHMRVTIRGDNEFIQATLDKDSGIKTSWDIITSFHVSMSVLNSTRNLDITLNELPLEQEERLKLAHKWARIFLAENDFPFKVPNELASLFVDSEYNPGYVSEEPSYTKYLEYKEQREKQWPRLRRVTNNELTRLNLPLIDENYEIVGQEVIDTFFNDPITLGLERGEFIMVHKRAERKSDYMSRRHIFQLLSLEPASVLFVCTGNTCRSHMAEHLMKYYLKLSGNDNVKVWSRGTLVQKIRIRTAVYKSLSDLNIPAPEKRHVPKQIADDDIRDADIIFVMAEGHKEHVLQLDPEAGPKVYLLTEFSTPDKESYSITDPSGQPDEVYADTAYEINEHIKNIVMQFKKMDIESLRTGTIVRQLEGHIQFETSGGMGHYLVQRAALTVNDHMLDIYALRDSDTNSIRYGRVYIIKELEKGYHRERLSPLSLSKFLEKSYFTLGPPLEVTETQRKIARKKLYEEPQYSILGEQVKGLAASQGRGKIVSGIITYHRSHKESQKKIFIAPFTSPDDIEAMKESRAVVTTGGGILSHAGITTREFGIPSVILHNARWTGQDSDKHIILNHTTPENYSKTLSGIWMSSSVRTQEFHIKEGDVLTVDGLSGTVIPYSSSIQSEIQKAFSLLEKLNNGSQKDPYIEIQKLVAKTKYFDVIRFIVNHVLSGENKNQELNVKQLFESIDQNVYLADDWAGYQTLFMKLKVEAAWTIIHNALESIASSFSIPQMRDLVKSVQGKIKNIKKIKNLFTQSRLSFPDTHHIDKLEKEKREELKQKNHNNIQKILDRKESLTIEDIPEIEYSLKAGKDNDVFSEALENLLRQLKEEKSQKRKEYREKLQLVPVKLLDENSISLAGGKSVRVGMLLNARDFLLRQLSPYLKESGCNFLIPNGFVITTHAFREFFHAKGIVTTIDDIVISSDFSPKEKSRIIQKLICDNMIGTEDKLGQSIMEAFEKCTRDSQKSWVAVRSSSILEDTHETAYAGMGRTALFVDKKSLLEQICDVKASAWTERAIIYSEKKKINPLEIRQAVLVQEMIDPEVSGIIFTQDPVTYNSSRVIINASYGLGEAVVSGLVLPDQYVTDKVRGEEAGELFIGTKRIKIVKNPKGSGTLTDYTDRKERRARALSLSQTKILTHIARLIEEFFHFTVDIEFAIQGTTIWIVQVRPVTTSV